MSEGKEQEPVLSEEDKKIIDEELNKVRKELVSEKTEKVIKDKEEKIRDDVKKELLIKQEMKDKEAEIEKLREAQAQKEREAAEKLKALQDKVDEMITSKAPVRTQDPFKNPDNNDGRHWADTKSDEEIDDVERKMGETFFGDPNLYTRKD